MGEIRTPRPKYFEGGVVEFFVKNKVVHYTIYVWNNEGLSQILYKTGIYQDNADDLIKEALQTFEKVSGK